MFTRLYIHIPFCQRKCPYCAFVSRYGTPAEQEAYVELLVAEMRLAIRESLSQQRIDSIYFGGGTPSLLRPKQVGRILEQAGALLALPGNAEITLETNPGTVDRQTLEGYYSAGVNRLSIGVQSFDDRMLTTLGRIHSARQTDDCMKAAREAGFDNIGIDLIHALPSQTLRMWRNDLFHALDLAPEHLSIYGLTIEEGTPFAEHYADDNGIPDNDLSADMFEAADTLLTSAGYEHYEIANYARPGCRSRHNSGYWKRDGYLGLGAGAHSFLRCGKYGIRIGNASSLEEYAAAINRGELPRHDKTVLSREESLAEVMFLGLRMSDGVTAEKFKREFGITLRELYGSELDELDGLGLLTVDERGVRLTGRGMLLSNQVFFRFLK